MRRAICSGSPPVDWRRNAPAVAAAAIASRSAREAETGTGAGAPTALVAPAAEAGATPGPIDVAAGAVAPGGAKGAAGGGVGGGPSGIDGRRRGASAGGGAGRRWRWRGVAGGAPRGLARWVVVQARRALAQEREAAWERAAARPTGCWRAAGSGAPSAVEGRWADRLRLPWRRRRLVRQCRRRPSAPTGCLQSLCLRPTVMTGASWGCLCPANPKARRQASAGCGAGRRAGAGPEAERARPAARERRTVSRTGRQPLTSWLAGRCRPCCAGGARRRLARQSDQAGSLVTGVAD